MTAPGFQIFWDGTSTGCGGTLTSPTGSISSPNHPQPYHHRAECIWRIHVSKGSKIQVVFLDLDLEQGQECEYDYVELRDGRNPVSRSLGKVN